MTEWDFILKNKPVAAKTASVIVEMSLGYMLDGTVWYTQQQYNQLIDVVPIPWDKIRITIKLDQQVIFESGLNDTTQVTYSFEDSSSTQTHALTIRVDGLDDSHRPSGPTGLNGGVMLKIHNITIEDINMAWGMPRLGTYVLEDGSVHIPSGLAGSNGTQTLLFSTPIYSWLVANHRAILNR
jgi:hypothetical protein